MKSLLLVMLIVLAVYTYLPPPSAPKIDVPAVFAATPATVINEVAVIKAIKAQGILATLEVAVTKEYQYDDSYKGLAGSLTRRNFKLTFDNKTYIGIDTSKITIQVEGNDLIVRLPAPELLSSENSNIVFQNDVGWLRPNLSDADKLYLLTKATESVKTEAMSQDNKKRATESAKKVLMGLLKQIPNVQSLEII